MNICIPCEDIPGMFTNEEYECEDICGDGFIVNKQCDDGNTISGDGCSGLCTIEFGFECLTAGQPCRENIPPELTIKGITNKQVIYLEFTEPVMLRQEGAISSDNLEVQIRGELDTYIFKWRIVEQDGHPLIPNRRIQKFMIVLSDMEQSLTGYEDVVVTFKDET